MDGPPERNYYPTHFLLLFRLFSFFAAEPKFKWGRCIHYTPIELIYVNLYSSRTGQLAVQHGERTLNVIYHYLFHFGCDEIA